MNNNNCTFPKSERISNKKDIEKIFTERKTFQAFPLRVMYTFDECEPADAGVSVLVSVSKKYFKRAVDRNRLKRLIRESYRLNKCILTDPVKSKKYALKIAFLYIHPERSTYAEVEKGMKKALNILLKEKIS
ncbi:MAG: ribonuclease P protein component [Dysgonamonadaceae bacterium]|jgi:ribonuclease P protein component|nr:ribonuclease P protein component [Dysgonamonadaceae bacterium]